jgi:amino acid transporter
VAGTCVFTGEYIAAFANLVVPNYLAKSYHVFLISTANAVLAIVINVLAVKLLHGLNKTMIVLFNAAAFYIFVVLLVKAQPKVSAYDALVKVVNETGWSSDGFVFLCGFLPGLLTVCLPDASAHLAEEIPQPQRNVPIVMFFTACLNAITGFVMVIALAFCTVAPENLMEPLAGVPILQIAKDTWDNHGWVITVAIIMLLVPLNGAIAITTGGSRLLWAFAKCGGILGGRRLGNTNVKLQVPANAVCATAILALLLSLLLFGPTTVLNGIFGSSGICMAVSYFLPILFMLLTDRKTFDERRHFNFGKWGRLINIAALVWLVVTVVSLSLPLYSPVTMGNMNWAGVVFLGLVVLLMGNWVTVKDSYTIPKPLCLAVSRG